MHTLALRHGRPLALVLLVGLGVATVAACHRDRGTAEVTSAPMAASANASAIPDADIAAAVTRHLKEDTALRTAPITVAVTNGICTLSGSVGSMLAKDRALRVAETLRGIRSVVDLVTVTPVTRTDDQIKHDVMQALQRDSATRGYPVTVTASDGKVTLTGTAPGWSERMFSANIAKGVPGVKAIDNEITVKYDVVPSDALIATAAKRRIANDIWLDGSTIDVTVSGRTAHLKGIVGSVADKARARDDAWLGGAELVEDDQLKVDWQARDQQRRTTDTPYRSDDDIANAIRDAVKLDPRLKALEPNVAVHEGDVELTGSVASAQAKRAAELDAKDTVGVSSVRDQLIVQPAGAATDADINRAVTRALARDLFLDGASPIHASTTKGKVVLEGNPDSAFARFDAVDDAASIPGVSEVVDDMVVKRTPQQIQADIEDRLFWDATVARDQVHVSVAPDATATLSGTLDSWSEIRASIDDATYGGAQHVINLLRVKSRADH